MHDENHAGDGTFGLDVVARAKHIAWIRSFASSVAEASGVPPDGVADVKLATSELATSIVARQPGTTIELRINRDADGLTFSVGPWDGTEHVDVDFDPWELVTMLFDHAHIDGDRAVFGLPLPVTTS